MNSPSVAARPSPLVSASTAEPEGATCSLLRMAVGDEVVAVGIEDVREILQVSRLTPMPRTPDFVRGVMNLRGAVVPVVDLSARLGRPPTLIGRRSCIVVVDYQAAPQGAETESSDRSLEGEPEAGGAESHVVMGVLVDAVFEVFDRPLNELEPPPAMGTRIPPQFLRGITRAGGELIGVLALPRLLGVRELTAGIANHQLN